jgi:phage gpG-like protein
MGLINVRVVGMSRVERMLIALNALQTMARYTLLRQLGNLIQKQHTRRILSEKTAPSGATWAPLKPSTVQRKGNANILVESGKMARAWQMIIGGDYVRMWNTARSSRGGKLYLFFHQYGTSKMVARPPMGFSAANEQEIHTVVNAWVARRIGVVVT